MKRVVITGAGAVSPLGVDVPAMICGIEAGKSAVRYMDGWDQYIGLRSLVGAPAEIVNEKAIPRSSRRSMGRMSIFSVQAAEQAILDSGIDRGLLTSGRLGCIIGSTMGSAKSINDTFEIMIPHKDLTRLSSMKFFQCISHTAVMNTAQHLGITGYVLATSAACASGLQAIGAGYDLIRLGKQDAVLCGGAEDLHPTVTGSFDILFATSAGYNNEPEKTPRPFDAKRDGLVCGEGSGILLIEEYEHALKRNAKIYAEIIGYHTCGSGVHVSQSNKDSMVACFRQALSDANIQANQVDYINAHATATIHGDKEEAEAIKEVFGDQVPVSSLKGYMGHTLGASGSIELIASLIMMQKECIYPTLNLETVSPECEGIFHVTEKLTKKIDIIVKNCFAFGGINASIVCKKIV
ncbi:MAG: beta-ketoacyl-[acyl-carrier-protein] synthase family protein [Desulfobacterium sp.]|nr:beta-ketoacyl-[acyl-carrier-protein] synthase family protein [Desulfobacterium sp.]MBU3950194.1 beta-ketoacyl-[acyl-carrier-protein] synthase family protein [Pseudomonadota bacterium]MBU4035360.1 beta-ketoacyl-[acyl-carrier-protein] synthase family protein [Pseudomonadota bacterium]